MRATEAGENAPHHLRQIIQDGRKYIILRELELIKAEILGTSKVANFALIAVISLVGFVISDDQRVPWAQITPAPSVPPQHLHQRGYDTSNPYLYGYTSVGMNGTRTICDYTMVYNS